MRTQQSGSTNDPVSVDQSFFQLVKKIIVEIRENAFKDISHELNIPVDKIAAIDRGEIPDGLVTEDKKLDNLSEEEREQFRQIHQRIKIEQVQGYLDLRASVSYNLDYNNGYTFQTNSVEQLIEILDTEAGIPEELTITAGGSTSVKLRLTVGGRYNTVVRYTIDGDRKDVDHISTLVRNLINASEPEHSWPHRKWPGHAINITTVVLFVVAYWFVILNLHLPNDAVGLLFVFSAIVGFAGASAASIPTKRLRRAFPACQFDFGPEKRRRGTYRSVIWALLTVLAVPMLIAWLFAR